MIFNRSGWRAVIQWGRWGNWWRSNCWTLYLQIYEFMWQRRNLRQRWKPNNLLTIQVSRQVWGSQTWGQHHIGENHPCHGVQTKPRWHTCGLPGHFARDCSKWEQLSVEKCDVAHLGVMEGSAVEEITSSKDAEIETKDEQNCYGEGKVYCQI